MAKILSITSEIVEIGEDNGLLTEVRLADLNFTPRVGDLVDVFRSENALRVVPAQGQGGGGFVSQGEHGININIANTQAVPTAQAYVPSGKVVNKVAYVLCAIFLGGLGIHKFMAGKVGAGIACILFCWTLIPEIVGIVEGIVALTKRADINGNIVV